MERIGFKLRLKPNLKQEYKMRHAKIWPEMTEVLNKAGIHNYTIWLIDNDLFGYYETEDNNYAVKVQNESGVVKKWNVYMSTVIDSVVNKDGSVTAAFVPAEQMFLHK